MNRLTPEQRETLEQIATESGKTLEAAAAWLIAKEARARFVIPAPRRSVTPFRRKP